MCGNMLFMDPQKSWLLIGRAKLISTNGPSFTFCTQPLKQIHSTIYLEQHLQFFLFSSTTSLSHQNSSCIFFLLFQHHLFVSIYNSPELLIS